MILNRKLSRTLISILIISLVSVEAPARAEEGDETSSSESQVSFGPQATHDPPYEYHAPEAGDPVEEDTTGCGSMFCQVDVDRASGRITVALETAVARACTECSGGESVARGRFAATHELKTPASRIDYVASFYIDSADANATGYGFAELNIEAQARHSSCNYCRIDEAVGWIVGTEEPAVEDEQISIAFSMDQTSPNSWETAVPPGRIKLFVGVSAFVGYEGIPREDCDHGPCSMPRPQPHTATANVYVTGTMTEVRGTVHPDTSPPETIIWTGPSGEVTERSATFSFSSREEGSTYACKLDTGDYSPCTSPITYEDLVVGEHTFLVRATDRAGNTDASPAERTWTITEPPPPPDTTAPETNIDSGPSGTVTETTASFEFSSPDIDVQSFACKLDEGAYGPCESPKTYDGLALGQRTFLVRATDRAGNTDASPAQRMWTVQTPPTATFVVNSVGDEPDLDPQDGYCDVTVASGQSICTLRAALEQSNAFDDRNTITFGIPGLDRPTITPTTWLPSIIYPLTLDATTQCVVPAPCVEIDASNPVDRFGGARPTADGFEPYAIEIEEGAPGTVIEGLAITHASSGAIGMRSQDSIVRDSYIGLTPTGSPAGNEGAGIRVLATGNTVGGTSPSAGNVISNNDGPGIWIGATGFPSSSTTVVGNLVGTDPTGTTAQPNRVGIRVASSDNEIGGPSSQERNLIAGNTGAGVFITSAGANNVVQGNWIGTAAPGTSALGNSDGLLIEGEGNLIGGSLAGEANVISGNHSSGVYISGLLARENMVRGNLIGTDADGIERVPNGGAGISIGRSPNNTLSGNVVSGNGESVACDPVDPCIQGGLGIEIFGEAAEANTVVGNLIGLDASGMSPLPNLDAAILVYNAPATRIGIADDGNVIAGNDYKGITLIGDAYETVIQGNRIGLNGFGRLIGNGGTGIDVHWADGTLIGGTGAATNWIAGNSGDGISIDAERVRVTRNVIYANAGSAIDLENDGVTTNDVLDADAGANMRQNFPVLTEARLSDGALVLSGGLESTPSSSFEIELFGNSECDVSNYGEAERFLGTTTVQTNEDGTASFTITWRDTPVAEGDVLTATATDGAGNTSEASQCRRVDRDEPYDPDRTAPETTITTSPSGTASETSATFEFSSSEDGSTFECSLDHGVFDTCESPKSYTDLAVGEHTFAVKATDSAGNTDPTPAERAWTITKPANNPPVAQFGFSCTDLSCTFTSGSSDADGTIAGYAWDFGDGNSSVEQNPSRTFGAAGTYTVTLTVTDEDGATGSVSHDVTVTAPSGSTNPGSSNSGSLSPSPSDPSPSPNSSPEPTPYPTPTPTPNGPDQEVHETHVVESTITLTHREDPGVFKGRVRSEDERCIPGRTVELIRKRDGRERIVAAVSTRSDGRWRFATDRKRGLFYARVTPAAESRESSTIHCSAASSREIRL